MTSATGSGTSAGKWLLALGAVAAAAGLLWVAASAHLQQACTVMDTPYLPLCAEPSADPRVLQQELAQRIRRNPGDAWAWAQLLLTEDRPDTAPVLQAAAALAPNNPNVLRWRAAEAMEAGKLPEAVALLVQMLQQRRTGEAAQILARLAATPEGLALLRPHLRTGSTWLPQVLAAVAAARIPPGQVLGLAVEGAQHGALPDPAMRSYMRSLKATGDWLDAYGLWLALHKQRQVPLLYNGAFDQPLVGDGFDWEFVAVKRSRAGVIVDQHAVARRGLVLDLEFTGRAFTVPIVRQYVFTPPGAYRLRGEYMASKLKSEGGLAWTVHCPSARKSVPAETAALQDTGGLWKVVEVHFTVPEDCGPVASIQLEPAAAFEARAGIKGRVQLDGFSLTRAALAP